MRSKLFVPASRPELFSKALNSDADALSFDLEDAVLESRKAEARDNLRQFLLSEAALNSSKTFIVRVNAADTPHFVADMEAVICPRLDLLNLPKSGEGQEVRDIADMMSDIEARKGVQSPIRLLLNIETPFGLRNAPALAAAHERVAGLQLGFGDLFEPLGIARDNQAAVAAAMFQVRMAAGEAGIFVCDSAYANTTDKEGFSREAARARDMGFIGKSCIHPSQIALANQVFRPSDSEIAHAIKVVESLSGAVAQERGAYVIDGRMIDEPFIQRAKAIVAQAGMLGLLPSAMA
jgi:citrate lyase subunit beta/citryl-CoA lyase